MWSLPILVPVPLFVGSLAGEWIRIVLEGRDPLTRGIGIALAHWLASGITAGLIAVLTLDPLAVPIGQAQSLATALMHGAVRGLAEISAARLPSTVRARTKRV